MTEKPDLFSIWENLKKEKKEAQESGNIAVVKKEVLIIDGHNTFLRCQMALPTLNQNGSHVGGLVGFLKSIGYAIKQFQPDRCIVVFDGVGGSMKRRKIYSEYKNHRRTKIRLNRIYEENALLTDEEDSMKRQLQRLIQYLQHLPVNIFSIENVEADDVMAELAQDQFKNWNVVLMSADRDFLQLVNDHIKVWSPTKKRLYGPEGVKNEYGVLSENFVYYRALDGDISDNIKGVKGCGLKTILKAFPMLGEAKIELNALKTHSKLNKDGKYKVYQTILDNWKDVERNYALMNLHTTNLTTVAQLHISEVIRNDIPKLNRLELCKMVGEDSISNNFQNFPSWLEQCFGKLNCFVRED